MAKVGRPKKILTSEEVLKKSKELEEKLIIKDIKEELGIPSYNLPIKKKEPKYSEWDVSKDDKIEFFDARLSYELTGYKPIDREHGLDFDPNWFTKARKTFLETGHYCTYPFNSKLYREFFKEEYRRCRDGYTVNGYTITGDQYFFLNYYRLKDLTSTTKAGSGREESFPKFLVKQYEYFHYIELCRVLRKDAIGLKARGVGFSEIGASLVVNTYSTRKESNSIIAAQLEQYVTKTLEKCWTQLDFLNFHSDLGFSKLRGVVDQAMKKRASYYKYINGQKVESGSKSQIEGITADKPNKIRGDRVDLLLYEESGSWNNWKKAFTQGDALVNVQGVKFGIKLAWGTGGDSGSALAGLSDAYYNPQSYGALPYRHTYTADGSEVLTGYFIPAYTIINSTDKSIIDSRGWTDPDEGKKYYEGLRAIAAEDPELLIIHCAEYCFTAEEALSMEGVNKFDKVKLTEQIARIKVNKEAPNIETGILEYNYKGGIHTKQNINGFNWIKSNTGKIHILEHPIWTIDNTRDKIKYLYVAGIDSIDIGKAETSEATKDPSDFCIVIKRRVYGMEEPQYVAIYKDRPNDIREAYKTAIKLMQYYNCEAVLEKSKTSILTWARDNQYLQWFMRRPRATLTDITNGNSKEYGAPATDQIIEHQTDLIANFITDYCHTIWFIEMLDEFNRYTDENKKKFDIVAAVGMCELGDEELQGIVPRQVNIINNEFQDIGFYYDEYGIKRHGIIPKKNNQILPGKIETISYDNYGTRTSNPNLL